ncbi:MAG: dihydrolipoyl dehydrogenase [Muribaculaceae bacterium]|nr:dihydrolipoyl dehydrogenase [Muribaculaceae bacterium]
MNEFDLIIIGAGPGGYETAAGAAASGLSVALIERGELGGTCLNRGCIPTKTLCKSAEVALTLREAALYGVNPGEISFDYAVAAARKDEVVSTLREGVKSAVAGCTLINGDAAMIDGHTVEVAGERYTAPRIIIATGSRPADLPVPGAEYAVSSDNLLSLTELPDKIVVVGGGVIGMEFASILNAFGVDVTVVEYMKEILPQFDKDIAKRLRSSLTRRGVNIITSAAVKEILPDHTVIYETKGKELRLESDMVVMAVGRRPVVPAGIENTAIKVGRRGIEVDESFMTDEPGVYAIGDVNGVMMLAHAASAQGRKVLGEEINLDVIPSAVFTSPECAMVGLTEEQCKEHYPEYKAVKVPFRGNGKALAMGEPDGLLKLIVDTASRKILGCHICGPHAADLIAEPALAMSRNLTVDAIKSTIHSHPTLTEVLSVAASRIP